MENENNKETPKPGWLTANKGFYRNYKYERERLKNNMTIAESKLWEYLKSKKLGVKFRRQHIIENYIPDFVSLTVKLIIEVDGGIHLKHKEKDKARTKWLEFLGYSVIRFTNEEIENDIEEVVTKIKFKIKQLTPPSLPKGEEKEQ